MKTKPWCHFVFCIAILILATCEGANNALAYGDDWEITPERLIDTNSIFKVNVVHRGGSEEFCIYATGKQSTNFSAYLSITEGQDNICLVDITTSALMKYDKDFLRNFTKAQLKQTIAFKFSGRPTSARLYEVRIRQGPFETMGYYIFRLNKFVGK